jgi:murein DD-endopeptidase MepM/ murein hydrolase activator NlpD
VKGALTTAVAVVLAICLTGGSGVVFAAAPSPSPSPACPSPAPTSGSQPSASATPTPTPGSAAALCEQKAQLDQIRTQLGSQLAAGVATERQLRQSLDANAQQQAQLRDRIAGARARAAQLTSEIAVLDAVIAELQARIDRDQAQLRRLARAVYRTPEPLLLRLLQAGSLRDMIMQAADTTAIGAEARRLHDSLAADKARQVEARSQKRSDLDQQTALARQLDADLAGLADLERQQRQTEAQLNGKIAAIRSQLAKMDAQSVALARSTSDELAREQDALIAKANQQAWTQLALWLQSNSVSGGTGTPTDRLAMPLTGAVLTQPFGPSSLWFEPPFQGYPHFHTGIDLAAPENTPVLAAADGIVAVVGSSQVGYGNYVIVAHADGVATLYGHLNLALVKVGDRVMQHQPIGLEGSTGNSTGPHLHFEVRINSQPVDPIPLLQS